MMFSSLPLGRLHWRLSLRDSCVAIRIYRSNCGPRFRKETIAEAITARLQHTVDRQFYAEAMNFHVTGY